MKHKNAIFAAVLAARFPIVAGPPLQDNVQESDAIEGLKSKMINLHGQIEATRATVDAEGRRISEEEAVQIEALMEEFDAIDDEVKMREKVLAQKGRLAAPNARKVPPSDLPVDPPVRASGRVTGGDSVISKSPNWGFRSMGEFAKAVVNQGKGNGMDERIKAAATTYGNETTLADGGFLVPPDFRDIIVKKLTAEESLLSRTDQQFTSGNRITMPKDDTSPWQSSGGIQCYWDDEAAAMTPSKPALGQIEVKASRLTALVPVTDEMLEDAPQLSRYLPQKVSDKYISKVNQAIIAGNGVGKPLGLLNSGGIVEVAIESGQDLTPAVVSENVTKMWSRMYAPLRFDSVWLINQDVEPFLPLMVTPGSVGFPTYLPPGGLSGNQYGTLMGRPVIAQEFCSALGTPGDIMLVNLKSYLTVQKVGGVKSDVSIHLYFDQGITAFRFVLRLGGQSYWSSTAARANGSNTLGNVITLGTRT